MLPFFLFRDGHDCIFQASEDYFFRILKINLFALVRNVYIYTERWPHNYMPVVHVKNMCAFPAVWDDFLTLVLHAWGQIGAWKMHVISTCSLRKWVKVSPETCLTSTACQSLSKIHRQNNFLIFRLAPIIARDNG